jgi:hypothetical protein
LVIDGQVKLQILIETTSGITDFNWNFKWNSLENYNNKCCDVFNENPIKIGKIIYGVFNKLYKLG